MDKKELLDELMLQKKGASNMNGLPITEVDIRNLGVIPSFQWDKISNINLIIGENGAGKTFLLKGLYSAVRTLEEYKRGDDIRPIAEVLAEKLRWTFQAEKLGDLVCRSSDKPLSFEIALGDKSIGYQFSQSATSKIVSVSAPNGGKEGNSIFIPAKEVLSLFSVILKSREVDKSFGFDDTYYDLAKALRIAPTRGRNYSAFAKSRDAVRNVIDGKIEYEESTGKWIYKNNRNQKFSIGTTSEGVKKIAIMDRMLANGYLDNRSIIFIDEVESALHPTAICQFLDMVAFLADKMNIQFFIASHSYFVIKKLAILAINKPHFISCLSLSKMSEPVLCDMHDGMPNNSIVDTSIELYEQEIMEGL